MNIQLNRTVSPAFVACIGYDTSSDSMPMRSRHRIFTGAKAAGDLHDTTSTLPTMLKATHQRQPDSQRRGPAFCRPHHRRARGEIWPAGDDPDRDGKKNRQGPQGRRSSALMISVERDHNVPPGGAMLIVKKLPDMPNRQITAWERLTSGM